jgi:hypothetical protein
MKHIATLLLIIPGLVCAALPAFAQSDYDYTLYGAKQQFFGTIATATGYDYGNSPFLYGGGYLYRTYPYLGFEFSVRHSNSSDNYSDYDYTENRQTTVNYFTASMHYYFSQTRVQPYLLLGGGFVFRKGNFEYRYGVEVEKYQFHDNGLAIEIGGGLDIYLTRNLSVRPDARLEIGPFGSAHGAISVGYHW